MAHRILTSLVGIDATFSSTLSLTSLAGVGNRMLIVNSAGTVSTQAIPVGTVTSVGLSMPSAFTVSSSPITGSGTITVTGAGTAVQYIRGDGTLGVFPDIGGGGGGTVYYLNGNTSQGSIGGTTMYQLSKVPGTGAAANFTRSTTGTIASFITDVGSPNQLTVPPGIWVFNAYLSETGGGSSHAEIQAVVEKWDGTTITVINTGPIEQITNGSTKDLYQFGVSIPSGITLAASDRIAIQIQISNTNGKTVTLYTEDSNICSVTTTFSNGLASLNGLTTPTQYFAVGTSGTDFGISSSSATHTFNLPTASATNRGALSSSDWSAFNGKVSGTGTTNYVPKWTGSTALGNSLIYDDGTNVGIGTASPSYKLDVNGTGRFQNTLYVATTGTNASPVSALRITSSDNGNGARIEFNDGNVGIMRSSDQLQFREYTGGFNFIRTSNSNTLFGISQTSTNVYYGTLTTSGSITAATALARGVYFNNTLVAAANNDVLVGLDVNPTFTNGAFTGVTNWGARLYNSVRFETSADLAQGIYWKPANDGTTLKIYGSSYSAGVGYLQLNVQSGSDGLSVNGGARTLSINAAGTSISLNLTNITFNTHGTGEAMRIVNSTKNVLIATTTDSGYKLDVNGNTRVANTLTVNGTGTNVAIQFIGGRIDADGTFIRIKSPGNYDMVNIAQNFVGINATSVTASAVFEVASTTRGFLPPRMTATQRTAISTPAVGLVVYQTDGVEGLYVNTSGGWKALTMT